MVILIGCLRDLIIIKLLMIEARVGLQLHLEGVDLDHRLLNKMIQVYYQNLLNIHSEILKLNGNKIIKKEYQKIIIIIKIGNLNLPVLNNNQHQNK